MARKKGGDRRKQAMADRRRPIKKKTSILTTEHIEWVDYKDVDLLRRFMSERAKIRARRVTGNSAQQQRAVARAIRVAREMALLPYSVRQVTQRSRGSRRDRERRDEGQLEAPQPPPREADGERAEVSEADAIDEATAELADVAEGADVAESADEAASDGAEEAASDEVSAS
jgi:small subunit ribosomal protein S18